jgi:hypothetical protein
MSTLFNNHAYSSQVLRHKKLPIYITYEFDFYRCVRFEDIFYGKTVSELQSGNLRVNQLDGRHSKLFSGERISYWADSIETAQAEVKKHGSGNNLLTFWAYDDATSTFPTISNSEPLIIIDGIELGFKNILDKIENNEEISVEEKRIVDKISDEKPDCLAYSSHTKGDSVNFLFFEKGFRKLALREVRLRLGDKKEENSNSIVCAMTSDYSPIVENYGCYFESLAKVGMKPGYEQSDEYKQRKKVYEDSLKKVQR